MATRAFNEIPCTDFEMKRNQDLLSDIQSKGKEYLLGVDEREFVEYLYENYLLEPLNIDVSSEHIGTPVKSRENARSEFQHTEYEVEVYTFTIKYKFTGSPELFRVQPNPWTLISNDIFVDAHSHLVSFSFKLYNQDPDEFKRIKTSCYNNSFTNLEKLNVNVRDINNRLRSEIERAFRREKDKYLKENDFFTAISIKVNPDTTSVFTTPTIAKKNIAQPKISTTKEFSSEPMMSNEMFKDVLKVIYDSGRSMEKKPALYKGKDEEGLRDQFLFVLETRYVGTTATGETFNRSGKTDILLKYSNDGSNLFVAECKFWHGSSEFLNAISQLFDRYLTWRDSKAALLIFVTNKDFSNVIATIKKDIKTHLYFTKEDGSHGETSLSFLFCLPQDREKMVHFEVMAFHYDK